MVRVVVDALPKSASVVAKLPLSAVVGSVRGLDILHDLGDFLLCWAYPGHRFGA